MPPELLQWLAEPASITAKLEKLGNLSVHVLQDTWGQPTQRERKKLGLRPREATRVREVLLKLDNVAVIYARSIIPARALVGPWRRLPKLGNQPLGGYLFKHQDLHRSPIEITQLPPHLFKGIAQAVWARRSVFQQYGQGVLVNEAFLPAILHFTNRNQHTL